VSAGPVPSGRGSRAARRLPPVTQLAVTSLALVIVSGIYLVAHLPQRAPLGPAVALLAAAGALLVANAALVSSLRLFAWRVFFQVAGWSLVAYLVIGGLLEFIFIFDHTRGAMLAVLTLSLIVFALDIPILFGFSVARYQEPAQPITESG
jgi:peptidoglycan/LPS O-acetylase OafA/YrhL